MCRLCPYAYFTPSQGSANRSASGGVLGAMARPASANLGFIPPLLSLSTSSHCGSFSSIVRCLPPLLPLLTTLVVACNHYKALQSITKFQDRINLSSVTLVLCGHFKRDFNEVFSVSPSSSSATSTGHLLFCFPSSLKILLRS